MSWMRCTQLLVVILSLLAPEAGIATDGAVEINATTAAAGGVTPGDAPGYPVTLSLPGSYRLTGNLTYADPDTTAIEITSVEVTLDLGGFAISYCTVFPPCQPGAGSGVVSFANGVTVKNGRISGMGADGIALQSRARVEDIDVSGNSGSGIVLNEGSVRRVSATGNGGNGVALAAGLLEDSVLSGNGASGASLGSAVSYARNVFSGNAISVDGGHATGGNVCSDRRCSVSGARRFYLSRIPVNGASALTACTAGFHMASMWEIHDPSALFYDVVNGEMNADAGQGAPASNLLAPISGNSPGWVRTGGGVPSSPATQLIGVASCLSWTSASISRFGTAAFLDLIWQNGISATSLTVSPWRASAPSCDSLVRVWCVED